jgi:hypothetical protein
MPMLVVVDHAHANAADEMNYRIIQHAVDLEL